jgi:DNA-binding MarR family transcriptional regulator
MPRSKSTATADEDLAFQLHAAMLHMMRRIRREDEAFGLSAPRMSALSLVGFGGSRTIGEMAAAEQVTPPTMTRLVQALERDGLVARAADPDDARVVRVRATVRGRRVMADGRRRRVAFLAAKLRALPASERATLERASQVLLRIYEELR